jgi:predicted double-glycine peptidase
MNKFVKRRHYRPIAKNAIKIPLPDVTQVESYSCGASSLQSICKYYGVGPDDEQEFTEKIGYDTRVGANPDEIMAAAHEFGLECQPYSGMTCDELKRLIDKGCPVMIMIQAWGVEKVGEEYRWIRDYRHVWQKGHFFKVRRDGKLRKVLYKGCYVKDWKDGHWVVAIGYDKNGFFFEDPSLHAIRGYLSTQQLKSRWRDTGAHGKHMPCYGIAFWKEGGVSMYEARAEYIR